MKKGIEIGKLEKEREIVIKLLEQNFSVQEVVEILDLESEKVRKIAKEK